jgi:hypothetical protein
VTLLLALLLGSAHAANVTLVNSAHGNATPPFLVGNTTLTVTQSITAGNYEFLALVYNDSASDVTAVTDTGGSTYAQVKRVVNGGLTTEIWDNLGHTPAANAASWNVVMGARVDLAGAGLQYSGVVSRCITDFGSGAGANPSIVEEMCFPNDVWTTGFGLLSAIAPTALSGTLEATDGTTNVQVAAVDITSASIAAITDSITHGAATWAVGGIMLSSAAGTATNTPTSTVTTTATTTATATVTATNTTTATVTASVTATATVTATVTATSTVTATATTTATVTATSTVSPTSTVTATITATSTTTSTATVTATATVSGTNTSSPTWSLTPTLTATITATTNPSFSVTFTATQTTTFNATATQTATVPCGNTLQIEIGLTGFGNRSLSIDNQTVWQDTYCPGCYRFDHCELMPITAGFHTWLLTITDGRKLAGSFTAGPGTTKVGCGCGGP